MWSTTPHATDNETAPNTVKLPTDMSTQNVAHHNNNNDVQVHNNTLEAEVANAVANVEAEKEKDDDNTCHETICTAIATTNTFMPVSPSD
jgi:hypothetical protein